MTRSFYWAPAIPIDFICSTAQIPRRHAQLDDGLSPRFADPPGRPGCVVLRVVRVPAARPTCLANHQQPDAASATRGFDMSASETVSAAGLTPGPAFAGGLLARLRGLLPRSINASPLLTRSGEPPEEPVVARHGVVEICRTVTAWALETCVKGEPERARETALRRLANYAAGRNNGNACLQTVRPMGTVVGSTRPLARAHRPGRHGHRSRAVLGVQRQSEAPRRGDSNTRGDQPAWPADAARHEARGNGDPSDDCYNTVGPRGHRDAAAEFATRYLAVPWPF